MRMWFARLTLAARLAGIHVEAWIPATIALTGAALLLPSAWALGPALAAALLAIVWWNKGAYTDNARDTMLARFHYQWALAAIADPETTPQLIAVHIERATRSEAKLLRRNQGRHTMAARALTLTVRPRPDQPKQAGPKWISDWATATQARYGFQNATDPRPAPLDINATEIRFGQERMPTEVRAAVA